SSGSVRSRVGTSVRASTSPSHALPRSFHMLRHWLRGPPRRMILPVAQRRGAARRKTWPYRPELAHLESRTLASIVSWLRPVSGDWDDPANWAGGQVPGANDDAVIPFAGIQVTHATAANDTIHSLTSEAAMDLSAGSLSIGVVPLMIQKITSRI